jgi:hypothetical protein
MDDQQFIQFLMDKINYFMRKIRKCKTKRKEVKKGLSQLDLDSSFEFFNAKDDQLKLQLGFNKGVLKDILDIKKNEIEFDKNNNEIEFDKNNELNAKIIKEELDGNISFIEGELDENLVKEFDKKLTKNLKKELSVLDDLEIDEIEKINKVEPLKRSFYKYLILIVYLLIIFITVIILFQWLSFSQIKKCPNCVRQNLDSKNRLVLKPVSNQLKQHIKYRQPACDQSIWLETQKLLGPKN